MKEGIGRGMSGYAALVALKEAPRFFIFIVTYWTTDVSNLRVDLFTPEFCVNPHCRKFDNTNPPTSAQERENLRY